MPQSLPLSALPFPLLQIDEDGKTGLPNLRWSRTFGGDASAPFSLEEHLDEASRLHWTRLWAVGWAFQCGVTIRTLNGLRRCVWWPEPDSEDEDASWLVLATDIENAVERIEANYEQDEVALRMSMQQWHSFFQESATGKAVVGPDGEIMALNPQMCEIFGYSEAEMLQLSPRELRYSEDASRMDTVYAELLNGGPAIQGVDVRYLKKDGSVINVLISISLVRDSKGHPLYFAVEIQDDTARRQAEAALEVKVRESQLLNEELERSNSDLERFAFVASHDLQEPLRKIRVFGGRLERALAAFELAEQSQDYLTRMLAATERMQQLISDLLEFSRPTPPQKLKMVDLTKLAQDAASDFEATLESGGGSVEIGELPTIQGIPPRLRQMLCNFIGNALKFRTETPPIVKISARQMEPEEHEGSDKTWWEIQVSDNGIGFDEKDLPRLLEVFGRLHPRDRFAGTGIGLAICRKVIQEHGGEISARSQPGEGATFIINLPEKQ